MCYESIEDGLHAPRDEEGSIKMLSPIAFLMNPDTDGGSFRLSNQYSKQIEELLKAICRTFLTENVEYYGIDTKSWGDDELIFRVRTNGATDRILNYINNQSHTHPYPYARTKMSESQYITLHCRVSFWEKVIENIVSISDDIRHLIRNPRLDNYIGISSFEEALSAVQKGSVKQFDHIHRAVRKDPKDG